MITLVVCLLAADARPQRADITAIAVSADGKRIAAGVNWNDGAEKALLAVVDVETGALAIEHRPETRVSAIAFSPDGKELAYTVFKEPCQVQRLSVPSGNLLAAGPTFAGGPSYLSYSPDGTRLAVVGSDAFFIPVFGKPNPPPSPTLIVWSLKEERAVHALVQGSLLTVRFAADGQSLLVGGDKGALRVIDARSGNVESSPERITDPSLSKYFAGGVIGTYSPDTLSLVRAGERAIVPAQIDSRISTMRVSGDGKLFWVGANDGVVRAFEPDTGVERYSLAPWLSRAAVPVPVAFGGARALAFSADGSRLVVASGTAALDVWDTRGGRLVRRMSQTGMSMASVTYLPDGSGIIAGTASGYAIELDPSTGESRGFRGERSGLAVNTVAVSNDGLRLAYGSSDGRIRLEISTPGKWAPSRRLLDHKGKEVREVAFIADGTLLASRDDDTLKLWNTSTGEPIATPPIAGKPRCVCAGGNNIGVCTDKELLLIDATDKSVRVLGKLSSGFDSCAIDSRGDRIALIARAGAHVWPLTEAGGDVLDLTTDYSNVRTIAFSPNGDSIAIGRANDIVLYTSKGREIRRLQGRARPQESVSFQPKGSLLAAGGRDGRVRIWDLARGRMIKSVDIATDFELEGTNVGAPVMLSLAPNGRHLGVGYSSGATMLWDLSTERPIALPEIVSPVHAVRFNAAGTKFFVGSNNGIFVYEAATGRLISKRGLALGESYNLAVDFYEDGEKAALGAPKGLPNDPSYSVMLADSTKVDKGTVLMDTGMPPNRVLNVSRDSQAWSVASWTDPPPQKPPTLWELAELLDRDEMDPAERGALLQREGKRINVYKMHDRAYKQIRIIADPINALDLRPDNRVIAVGFGKPSGDGQDNSLRLLDVQTGTGPRLPHDGAVLDLEWRDDGNMLAAASLEGSIRLWKPNGEPIANLIAIGDNDWAITLPDGRYAASLGAAKDMSFRVGNRALPFDQFDLLLHRPDVVAQALAQGWDRTSPEQLAALKHQRAARLAKVGYSEDQLGQNFDLPQVRIERRDALPTRTKQRKLAFNVSAYSTHAALEHLQVSVNEVPALGRRGLTLTRSQRIKKDVVIDLSAGRNVIQVSAIDAAGAESLRETFEVELEIESNPTLFVLSVGVSKYAQRGYDLSYSVSDAQALATLFKDQPGRFARVEAQVLADGKASRQGILAARKFLAKAGPDDMVVVLFAGHGLRSEQNEFYFATHEVDFKHPEKKGLSAAEIEGFFDDTKARRRLLLMDACYSGESDGVTATAANETPSVDAKGIKLRGMQLAKSRAGGVAASYVMETLFADLRRGSGAMVIAAAAGVEQAAERSDLQHGIFTYALIDGMTTSSADKNFDGIVQISELREHVVKRVRELSGGAQTPTVNRDNLAVDFPIAWRPR